MNATDIPQGFERHFRRSPLTDPWEPLYSKRTDKAVIIGLRLGEPHTNARGLEQIPRKASRRGFTGRSNADSIFTTESGGLDGQALQHGFA